MISEMRYVIRSLSRRKVFSLVTVLTLALGIGAATAIYSLVDWVLFHPIPSPPGVYVIGTKSKEYGFSAYSFVPYYDAYSGRKDIFTDFAACTYSVGNIVVEKEPVANGYISVTPHFLKIIGVVPFLGRNFTDEEGSQGRNDVVIVANWFWKKNLGATPDALGRTIIVDQRPCTVIGVLREGQRLPPNTDGGIFRPMQLKLDPKRPWDPYVINYGQARPEFTRESMEAALAKVDVDLPAMMRVQVGNVPSVVPPSELQQWNRPELRWMMLGAVGFLYAISCLNATNLMLVHMFGKQREISVRLALGGGRWSIIRLLAVEAMGLCLCGSGLGAVLANLLIPYFNAAGNGQNAALDWTTWHLYWRTYIVLGGLTVFTAFAITFVPAIQVLRSDIQAGLKSGGGSIGESPRLSNLRSLFVILQATFAMILLIGAGLMVESFRRLDKVDIGYSPLRKVKLSVAYTKAFSNDPKERLAFLKRFKESLLQVPGVNTVAYSSESLMSQYDMTTEALQADGVTKFRFNPVYISEDYQQASGVSLKSGKWMSVTGNDAMVNEAFARVRFGKQNPVGQYVKPAWSFSASEYKGWQIVGVVADIHEKVREAPGPKAYLSITVAPDSATNFILEMTSEAKGPAEQRIRQAVYRFDPQIVVSSVSSLIELRDEQLRNEHLVLTVLDVLASIAIVLTIVGMFSVLAYTVDRRMPEFGIRMALGAQPSNLVALVMRRGIALTSIGIVLGIAGTLGLTRFLQTLLFETPPNDTFVIVAVAALLIVSASGACILPAIRASKPDLLKLLKSD